MGVLRTIDILDIEGIGVKYRSALKKADINNIDDFLDKSILSILRKLNKKEKISEKMLKKWRQMAELMQVDGITNQFAEALVRSGTTSLYRLSKPNPKKVLERIKEAHKKNIIPEDAKLPTLDEVIEWQKDAIRIMLSGVFSGKIIDSKTKKPIKDSTIKIGYLQALADSGGRFRIHSLAYGKTVAIVFADKYLTRTFHLDIKPEKLSLNMLKLKKGSEEELKIDESEGKLIRTFKKGDEIITVQRDFKDIGEGIVFQFRKFYKRKPVAKLLSLERTKIGHKMEISQIKVDKSMIPKDAKAEDLFIKKNGKFQKLDMSFKEFIDKKYNLRVPKQFTLDKFKLNRRMV